MATETAVRGLATSSSSGTISRRVLRKTLNDALAIASYAVQLDTEGEYARSMEAYQQSVTLLDQGIGLMQLQREMGTERPGRDTSHEIAQLEQIREKYAARINTHRSERDRKAAVLAARDSHYGSNNHNHHHSTSSRRPRTPQGASIPPPQHPPPNAPLPPIPPLAGSSVDNTRSSNDTVTAFNDVLQSTRPRGASLPSNQGEPGRHETHDSAPSPQISTNVDPEINGLSRNGSFSLKSPKTPPPPTPSTAASTRTTNVDAFPIPKKRTKSIGRPQTAPGPSSPPNNSPIRTRTTSGATPPPHVPPKRSNSSTALSSSAASPISPIVQAQGQHRLQRFGSSTNIRHGLLSPSPASLSSKRVDLIPLREKRSQIEVPAFATIYGLEPMAKVSAPPPPPMPTDPQRHSYHLLRLILGTLNPISSPGPKGSQPSGGGFITPRLYVPAAIWHQPDLWTLVVDLQDKTRLLETLRETLRTVHETSVIHFGHVFFSPLRAPTKLKKTKSSENSLPAIPTMDDPIEWLQSLEKLANVTCEMERSMSKKLGMGENGASVTKKMVDWSTRMAKKTIGGKGPSNDLMVAYVDALSGVCAFGAMLDAHLCALRTVLPQTTPATRPAGRRPTLSRSNTIEAAKALSASQTNIASVSNAVPDFKSDPDVLPPAATQIIPKYSELPKFVNTQALAHLEKATKVFSSFIIPFIVRDLAILIQGLQSARNGEWMGHL